MACFTEYRHVPPSDWIADQQGKLSAWAGGLIKLSTSLLVRAAGLWLVETSTETLLLQCWWEGECQEGHGLDGSPTMSKG